jgi:hypothetical protein
MATSHLVAAEAWPYIGISSGSPRESMSAVSMKLIPARQSGRAIGDSSEKG